MFQCDNGRMARLTIWYPGARDPEVFDGFSKAVQEVADVVADAPERCDVFIEGRPSEEQLKCVREGGAVVVPFAGVPPATGQALRSRPDLTLHNLHHNSVETAETALALLLSASRRIVTADRAMRMGDWTPRYTPEECIRLAGRTAVVLGIGGIGKRVATALAAMGVEVIGVRRGGEAEQTYDLEFDPFAHQGQAKVSVTTLDRLPEVLPVANFLMVTLPLTPESEGLIGAKELAMLQKPSIVVNIARATIVREKDLYEALKNGVLHAAGLDVWYRYPKHPEGIVPGYFNMPEEAKTTYPSEYPFHELDNLVMSPHRGGSSAEAEENRIEHLAMLVRAFAEKGQMPNQVNIEAGY